jgi:hypothetical protein
MVAIRKWSVASALVAGVWLLLAGVKAQQPAPPPGNYVAGEAARQHAARAIGRAAAPL